MIRTICKTFMGAVCAILFIGILFMYVFGLAGCAQSNESEYQNYNILEQIGVM